MTYNFKHGSLDLTQRNKVIFTSLSKRNFYLRSDISAFVLKSSCTPISPFMNFDYNLAGIVDKDLIRVVTGGEIVFDNEDPDPDFWNE